MRFPIVEAINAGRCWNTDKGKPAGKLPDCAYVNCDAVATFYWHAETDGFDLRTNEFGIIRPPFRRMYMEWGNPTRVYADGGWHDRADSAHERHAVVLGSYENDDGSGTIRIRTLSLDRGQALVLPFLAILGYDEHGLYRQLQGQEGDKGPQVIIIGDAVKRAAGREDDICAVVASWYNMACLAISFMHCKSAGVEWHTTSDKICNARVKRGNSGPTSYGYVKVPAGLTASSTRADRRKATENQMSAHWVRGHFKTYTADAPLFGDKVGSWWWQPTVRGVGEAVRKPYQVSPG